MPKITKQLTSTQVKHAKPKEREYNLSDPNSGYSITQGPSPKKEPTSAWGITLTCH